MTYNPACVYLMRNEWSHSNYKIGMSNHPDRRHLEVEDQYRNVCPRLMTMCWMPTTRLARKVETMWHTRFRDKRTDDHGGREWFSLSVGDVSEFTHWAENSKSASDLKAWLFRDAASSAAVDEYRKLIMNAIPKRRRRFQHIDLWQAPEYLPESIHINQIHSLNLINS